MNLRLCWESLDDEPGDAEQHRRLNFYNIYKDKIIANLTRRNYLLFRYSNMLSYLSSTRENDYRIVCASRASFVSPGNCFTSEREADWDKTCRMFRVYMCVCMCVHQCTNLHVRLAIVYHVDFECTYRHMQECMHAGDPFLLLTHPLSPSSLAFI